MKLSNLLCGGGGTKIIFCPAGFCAIDKMRGMQCFEKSIENVKQRINVNIVTSATQLCRLISEALPGVLGIQGEGLFIFRDLGRRVIYFQGFGEKAGFWGAGSRVLRKNILGSWGERSFFFQGAGSKDPPGGASLASQHFKRSGCSTQTWQRCSYIGKT